MKSQLNRIHCQDCIAGMAKLPAGSIDLAFADPPFNIGYEYDAYDDRLEAVQYLDWSRSWLEEVKRVLKPDGTFWLAIGDEYAAELKVMLTGELGFVCRSWVVWYYTFGVNCKHKFSRSHAHLFHMVRDAKSFTFNADDSAIRIPSARQLVYGDKRANPKGRLPDDTWILRPQDVPDSFQSDEDTWYFPRVNGTFKERKGWHGCQMPEQLLGRIIRACSHPGETVLDPFAGSGTTLAVAKKLGRKFIGYELSQEYAARAQQRIKAAQKDQPLDGTENPLTSAPSTKEGRRLDDLQKRQATPRKRKKPDKKIQPSMVAVRRTSPRDTERVILESFEDAHDGFSSDFVIANPELNAAFIDACRSRGVAAGTAEINHLLMGYRKAGKLKTKTTRRVELPKDLFEQFSFASEIATRRFLDQHLSLDDVLCDPELAEEFDQLAESFAPGFSSFHYRWGALRIRKAYHERQAAVRVLDESVRSQRGGRGKAIPDLDFGSIPASPGVYRVTDGKSSDFYIGETSNLRERVERQFCEETTESWERISSRLFLRFIKDIPFDSRAGLQLFLIGKRKPLLNYWTEKRASAASAAA